MARTTVESQLAKLRKAKEALEKKEKALLSRTQGRVIAKIVELALASGISAAQISEALKDGKPSKSKQGRKKVNVTRGKVAPKYRNPENPEQTWTGRGKTPLWAQELKSNGKFDLALIN